jgi:hypothetical protein
MCPNAKKKGLTIDLSTEETTHHVTISTDYIAKPPLDIHHVCLPPPFRD